MTHSNYDAKLAGSLSQKQMPGASYRDSEGVKSINEQAEQRSMFQMRMQGT